MGKKSKAPVVAKEESSSSSEEETPVVDAKRKRDDAGKGKKDVKTTPAQAEAPKKDKKEKKDKKSKKEVKPPSSDEESEEEEAPAKEEQEDEASEEQEDAAPVKKAKTSQDGGEYELFIGNCASDINDDDVTNLFEGVTILNIKWLSRNGEFAGKGFIKVSSQEDIDAALKHDGATIKGSAISLQVPRNAGGGGAGAQEPTMFLGGVSDAVTEDDVRALFKECGDISQIRWGTKDGNFAGYGFVVFDSQEALTKAIEMNGTELCGRPIRCDNASARDGGGRGGGRGGRGGGGGRGGRGGGGFGGGRGGRGGGGFGGGRGGRGGGFGGGRGRGGGGFGGGRGGGRGRGRGGF